MRCLPTWRDPCGNHLNIGFGVQRLILLIVTIGWALHGDSGAGRGSESVRLDHR